MDRLLVLVLVLPLGLQLSGKQLPALAMPGGRVAKWLLLPPLHLSLMQ